MTASEPSELDAFLDFLYEGLEGYVYLAASDRSIKEDGTKDWKQEFFEYPKQVEKIRTTIRAVSKSHEVYIAPALFKTGDNSLRSNFKVSNVVWTEFDGNAPDWKDTNTPSLVIQSSDSSNQHVYWKLNEPITDVTIIEDINRRITYNMGADASAWDANQVLRPPETINHKRSLPVGTVSVTDRVYDIGVFEELAPAPDLIEVEWKPELLPPADKVLLSYAFGPEVVNLLAKDKVDDRSTSLMNLAYACAEIGLNNNEIMVMLIMADDKWEKFKFRKDRMKRLAHIVTVARNKHPESENSLDQLMLMAFGFESFLDIEINLNWLIEGMLIEQGFMLLVGPSGLGKTQFTLQWLIHLALGKDHLGYSISEPKKVAFLSLEMGHGELKIFLEAMNEALDDTERTLLEKNLILIPVGEPLALNKPEGQRKVLEFLQEHEDLEGLAVDSLGSAIQGNISSDEVVQPFTEFTDKIRNKYGIFTWYIHHMRKSKDGPPTQDDVYGNQYIFNRSTSSYAILKSKSGGIRVKNFKNRLAPLEKDYFINRDEHLNFHRDTENVTSQINDYLLGEQTDLEDKSPGGMDL